MFWGSAFFYPSQMHYKDAKTLVGAPGLLSFGFGQPYLLTPVYETITILYVCPNLKGHM